MIEPDEKPNQWENVRFRNNRGQWLAGLWIERRSPGGLILTVCHGFTGSKEGSGRSIRMAERFAQSGVSVLLFDFAGNGQSEGRFAELTLSGQMDDLSCALDWCLEREPGSRLVSLGRSFGGTTAICQAAADSRVSAVCTWAAPAYPLALFDGFRRRQPDGSGSSLLASDEGTVRIKDGFFDDLKRHDVLRAVARISPRPLLVVHGSRDEVVPFREAEALYRAAGHPKELRKIDGGDHRFSQTSSLVWDVCQGWLERLLQADGERDRSGRASASS